jgi:hypothetical protein
MVSKPTDQATSDQMTLPLNYYLPNMQVAGKAKFYTKIFLMFSELLSGVFIQGPFVCNALKKLSDERWEKFLGHFSTKGMHCSPILLHSGLRNVEFI